MEIPGNPWLLGVAVLAALAILVLVVRGAVRKRVAEKKRADRFTLQHIFNVISHQDQKTYARLPNRESRLDFLARNYPEFAAAAERHFPQNGLETGAAHHIDIHMLRGALHYQDFDTAVRIMRNETIGQSLVDYQVRLHASNAEERKREEEREKAAAKRREENLARLERAAAELAAKKASAKKHWDSLSSVQKEAFKKAKGPTARKQALAASTNDSAEIFYPLIMAMEFSTLNPSYSNSLDYCESSTSSHSGYSGYSSHSDSGSSYSSSDSSSSSSSSSSDGGGGGGGGE